MMPAKQGRMGMRPASCLGIVMRSGVRVVQRSSRIMLATMPIGVAINCINHGEGSFNERHVSSGVKSGAAGIGPQCNLIYASCASNDNVIDRGIGGDMREGGQEKSATP